MSEEAIKQQRNRLIQAVVEHFHPLGFHHYRLDGNPFHLEFFRPFNKGRETWKIRCVPGEVCQRDYEVVKREPLNPEQFTKAIAYRPAPGSMKFELREIE